MWSHLATAPLAASEPDRSSTVWALVALLVVMGVALVMLAVWMVRTTRPDPEVLAPLERMSDRSWRNTDPVWQRRDLDDLRPEGAEPIERMAALPALDEQFDRGPQAPGFDDLRGEQVGVGGNGTAPQETLADHPDATTADAAVNGTAGEPVDEPVDAPIDEPTDEPTAGHEGAPDGEDVHTERPV